MKIGYRVFIQTFSSYRVFIVQAYQTSQYVVPRGGIFLGKWRREFRRENECPVSLRSQHPAYLNISKFRELNCAIAKRHTLLVG
jgi:hypothetical protein